MRRAGRARRSATRSPSRPGARWRASGNWTTARPWPWCPCSWRAPLRLGDAGEEAQGAHRRLEEVLTAARRDEARLRLEKERRVAGDRHLALRPVRLADQEVLVAAEAERVAVVDPQRLDRLELAPDVGLEADEDEAAVGVVARRLAVGQRRPVAAAAADDPVTGGEAAVEEARRVARVRAADVGAGGAAQAERIVRVAEGVDAPRVGADRGVGAVGGDRQRR